MRFRLFGHLDNPQKDRPVQSVSKSTAVKWINLGTHFQIDKQTIQAIDPAKVGKRTDTEKGIAYVPDSLPPEELLKIRFREPKTETWMLMHRAVNRFWAEQCR
jgi:hypothetical protein